MRKSKFTDAELENLESMGMKPADIAKKLGVTPAAVTQRQKKRDEAKKGPEPSIIKKQDPVPLPPQSAETSETKPFPFEPKDDVIYGGQLHRVRSVGQNRMILCRNADMKAVTIMLEDYQAGRAQVKKVGEKPPIKTTGEDIVLKNRKTIPAAGDIEIDGKLIKELPNPDKEKIADKLKNDAAQFQADREQERKVKGVADAIFPGGRKPATINKDFEDLFSPTDKIAQYRPCAHFLKDCDHPEVDNCEECQDYIDAMEIAEASEKAEPFNLDLEMDNLNDGYIKADPTRTFGGRPISLEAPSKFESVDYTDEAWGGAGHSKCLDAIPARREYLDKIDQLLDLVVPGCKDKDVVYKATGLAISILVAGINKEAGV